MPPKKRHLEVERIWSLSLTSDEDKPVVMIARQVSDGRQVNIRLTPRELRWVAEHATALAHEFDLCNVCSHPRKNHVGVQGELVRGVCRDCDRFCTRFSG
jgi:hypothetical protein